MNAKTHTTAPKLFGTDGIRGRANQEPMTAQTALKVATAAAHVFRRGAHRHRVVIGKDTRLSGYLLEPALTAGFISQGMDVVLLGPIPTPGVAMLVRSMRADLGVMLSASHNPYEDNGVKLFGPDGDKLSDALEAEIEAHVATESVDLVDASDLGRASRLEDATGRYIEYVKATAPRGLRLDGMKIVVDCANGAAYRVAPTILWELGAEVIPVAVTPDGRNINRHCGATAPTLVRESVLVHHADVGLALDGDADRLIMVDDKGQIVNGDAQMAVIAAAWHQDGLLRGRHVVGTVMTNLGLERFLSGHNIGLIRTPVGDRHVVAAMQSHGCNLGGEPSGHIVLGDVVTTGDGLVAALQLLSLIRTQNRPAHEVLHPFVALPQIMRNVRASREALETPEVVSACEGARRHLGAHGRLVVRASGTEPVVRVMAEGEDEADVRAVVDGIVGAIARA